MRKAKRRKNRRRRLILLCGLLFLAACTAKPKKAQVLTQACMHNLLSQTAFSQDKVYVAEKTSQGVQLSVISVKEKTQSPLCSLSYESEEEKSTLWAESTRLFYHRNSLYAVQNGGVSRILRVNENGSEQEVCRLAPGEGFGNAVFGWGEDVLAEIQAPKGKARLVSINLQTGRQKKLCGYPQKPKDYYSAISFVQDKLVFLYMGEEGNQYFWLDPARPKHSIQSNRRRMPITGLFDDVNLSQVLLDETLCTLDYRANAVSYENLATGKKIKFPLPKQKAGESIIGPYVWFDEVYALAIKNQNGGLISAVLDKITGKASAKISHTEEHLNSVVAVYPDVIVYQDKAQGPDRYCVASKEDFLCQNPGTSVQGDKDG